MRNNDRDLIMALAEGSIDGAEAAALEAALDDEGKAELAAQRFALHMMQAAPPPALTDLERERIHVRVLAEGRAAPHSPRGRRRWMPVFAGGTAVVVAVVAIAAALNTNGVDDMAGAETTITAAAARSAPQAAESGEALGGADLVEPGIGSVSSTTLAAGASTTDEAPDFGADLATADLVGLRKAMQDYDGPIAYNPSTQPCYERVMEDDGRPVLEAYPGTWSGNRVVAFFLTSEDPGGPPLRIYLVDGCTLKAASGE